MAMTAPITSNIVDKSRIAGDFLLEMPVYISTLVLTKIGPQPDWTVIYTLVVDFTRKIRLVKHTNADLLGRLNVCIK